MIFNEEAEEELQYESVEDESEVSDVFDTNDFISIPIKSETCTMDENIIQLQYPLSSNIMLIKSSSF